MNKLHLFFVLFLFFNLNINIYLSHSTNIFDEKVHLVYYVKGAKIYNLSDNRIEPINKYSEYVAINVDIYGNRVTVKFSPVPLEVYREFVIYDLKNTIKIKPNESVSEALEKINKTINEFENNITFVNTEYNKYLNNFTISIDSFTMNFTVSDTGYTVEEPEMGLFPFYVPYVITSETVDKYRPVYFGCPINERDVGIYWYTVPDSILKYINEKNLYDRNTIPLIDITINCKKSIILNKTIYTIIRMKGNYLFSANELYIKYGDRVFRFFDVRPSNDTIVYLANLPVNYLRGENLGRVVVAVAAVVVGVAAYVVWRRWRG